MAEMLETAVRFLHVLAGIVWIGHLYFFNLTNLPVFKFSISNGDPNVKGGPSLVFRALFWFRWGAMLTLLLGLYLLDQVVRSPRGSGRSHMEYLMQDPAGQTILIGMLMGLVMWFNVWFVIWPAQKRVLPNLMKIAKGVPDEEKTRLEAENKPLAARAKMASRINFWLSIPMLVFMVFAAHAPFAMW